MHSLLSNITKSMHSPDCTCEQAYQNMYRLHNVYAERQVYLQRGLINGPLITDSLTCLCLVTE